MKKLLATAALAVIATSAMTSCQDTKATSGNGATDYTQYVNPLMAICRKHISRHRKTMGYELLDTDDRQNR